MNCQFVVQAYTYAMYHQSDNVLVGIDSTRYHAAGMCK